MGPLLHDAASPLGPAAAACARAARGALERGDAAAAVAPLDEALKLQPGHPELLRLCGLVEQAHGRYAQAAALFEHVRRLRPADAGVVNNLGAALAQGGRLDAAAEAFRQAAALDPALLDAWLNLARALDQSGDARGALAALDAALRLAPRHEAARVLRAGALKTLGRLGEAEAALRALLREDPRSASAWIALAQLRGARAEAGDLAAVERLLGDAALPEERRDALRFAQATMLEAAGRYADAYAAFVAANAARRRRLRWDGAAVSALVDALLAAFPDAPADADDRGAEAIFLVGMPRSGSTLAEQILAAHPQVDAGGEREDVVRVLHEESRRRGRPFPAWAADATADDWRRLGEAYLERAARWRGGRARFTDKTPTNWQTLGAIRRMLPGARIVHCVRDPLETCWSCFKLDFGEAQFFTYDLGELARFQRDCARAMRAWSERFPGWIHAHQHEALLARPEAATRALLAHCGLAFDPACLRFHEVEREVRTASAAQVRRPLHRAAPLAARYGALLDPLRRALDGAG